MVIVVGMALSVCRVNYMVIVSFDSLSVSFFCLFNIICIVGFGIDLLAHSQRLCHSDICSVSSGCMSGNWVSFVTKLNCQIESISHYPNLIKPLFFN